VSRKSERLVNLVIALLATRRNLTKSEIFRTIDGYEGNEESMERMFERDKDELRSLGIEIEVSGLDPLFDDELGYRIKPENFAMDTKGYSLAEIAYMSLAAQLWKNASLNEPSQRALRKLSSFTTSINITDIPAVAPITISAPNFLDEIITAISDKKVVEFSYVDSELKSNRRRVNVYSYASNQGFWYFNGLDIDKNEIRTFRCDRIVGDVIVANKSQDYEIPEDWEAETFLGERPTMYRASLRIRVGRGSQLRNIARSIESQQEHDLVEIEYPSESEMISLILWHLDDVEVVSPDSLRFKVIESLKTLAAQHG
jgi:proteasome accessory factor B